MVVILRFVSLHFGWQTPLGIDVEGRVRALKPRARLATLKPSSKAALNRSDGSLRRNQIKSKRSKGAIHSNETEDGNDRVQATVAFTPL
jgi:hypothetical protein